MNKIEIQEINILKMWSLQIRNSKTQNYTSKVTILNLDIKKHLHGIYATKFKQMLDDLRDYAKKKTCKLMRDARGQEYEIANGVTRLVQQIRRRMKLYED